MDKFWKEVMTKFRGFRDRNFSKIGESCIRVGISANAITSLSLILGLFAIYYLFDNTWLFVLFAAAHLIADGLDGVLARASKTTEFGRYFDYLSDRTITLLILIKIGWFFNDYYAYLVAGLFIAAQTIYAISKMKAPILFTRMIILGLVAINLPTIAYLTTGIASIYSLARQLQWYIAPRR